MRNRAKCKLCGSIIESFHPTDYVSCKCGEISVDGGESYRCYAKSYDNFLRVDDEGNEIIVTVKPSEDPEEAEKAIKIDSKKELLDMLAELIKSFDRLPAHAMSSSVTQSDLQSVLVLLLAIFRADSCIDES